jgi:hypothetical protein
VNGTLRVLKGTSTLRVLKGTSTLRVLKGSPGISGVPAPNYLLVC